jgi:inosine-uridine nucleoside N-ribohydrolase
MLAGVYLHDPTIVIAAVNPSLLTYTEGVVRVQTVGITRGLTVFDNTKKRSVQSLSVEYRKGI